MQGFGFLFMDRVVILVKELQKDKEMIKNKEQEIKE